MLSNKWLGLATLATFACDQKGDEGDDGDDVEGFQLTAAAFTDDFSTLVLTFSDPVASVDAVAPTDFRISVGIGFESTYEGMTYGQSAYYEPNTWGEYSPYEPIEMTAIANGPGANQISITLGPRFEPSTCASVSQFLQGGSPSFVSEGGVFPHYAPGATPVTNTDGVELAAIGAEWVLAADDDEYYYGYELFVDEFGFPNLTPRIPIPCPL